MTNKTKKRKLYLKSPFHTIVAVCLASTTFALIIMIGIAGKGYAQFQVISCVGQDAQGKSCVYISCLKDKQSHDWLCIAWDLTDRDLATGIGCR